MASKSSSHAPANPESISVLFVCLGNICRSPMAEAVFAHLSHALGPSHPRITTDSAGTGAYHTGSPPDSRTMATLQDHGITKYRHAARQVKASDFKNFDYVFAMDGMNFRDLKRRAKQAEGEAESKVSLFGSWGDAAGATVPETGKVSRRGLAAAGEEIDDPYYGGEEGFEVAFQQSVKFSRGWLKSVLGVDTSIDSDGKVTISKIESQED